MKIGFYPRLAWSGIRKNRELYIPYLLTCTGMIMMFYIVSYLYTSTLMTTERIRPDLVASSVSVSDIF